MPWDKGGCRLSCSMVRGWKLLQIVVGLMGFSSLAVKLYVEG